MNTQTKPVIMPQDYKKEYCYKTGSFESCNGSYTHPYVSICKISHYVSDDNRYFIDTLADIQYQRNNDGDHKGLPYGGRIEYLKLENIVEFSNIINKAIRKSEQIDSQFAGYLYSGNPYANLITTLRTMGILEVITGYDTPREISYLQ